MSEELQGPAEGIRRVLAVALGQRDRAVVLQSQGQRQRTGAFPEQFHRFGQALLAAAQQPVSVRGGSGERQDAGIEGRAAPGRSDSMGRELMVSRGQRDADQQRVVRHVHREQGQHRPAPVFAQHAEPPVRARQVAVSHGLQHESPDRVGADAGDPVLKHHRSDLGRLPGQSPVPGVQRHAFESTHPGCVQDADHLRRRVQREVFLENGGRVRQAPQLEQLPPAPGLEHGQSPALPVTLRRGDVLRRDLERLTSRSSAVSTSQRH